ncbi:Sodium/iodide cotransporter [Holothuria leucospilota]|uniref:Sodium/iodide cotransporter n=1 Tax=Holothuria leucospilota TaxID=206669 RepID=A0A9Q1HJN4_HOLLE|nr:Sodium/iodide cotransporter [Holothuria leucospilota]
MIFVSFLFITIFAVRDVGGFANVWKVTSLNGRQLTVDFRPSPALPYTFWSSLIAGPCIGLYRSVCSQHVAQRYLSVKRVRQAVVTALVGQILSVISYFWLIFIGLAMFTFYAGCDPFTLGDIQTFDQMLPYFILDLFQNIPGIVGILVSAICSAAVSSVSSGINALSLICHKEILQIIDKDLTPKQELIVTKILTGAAGILTLLLTFLAPHLGGILDALLTWQGILLGPILGAYVLGIFFRGVNTSSCLIGITLSFAISATLKVGNMLYPGAISVLPPLRIDECNATTYIIDTKSKNLTSFMEETPHGYGFSIWHISTFYYGAISTYLTIIIGLMMSLTTKSSDFTIDEKLLWRPRRDLEEGEFDRG